MNNSKSTNNSKSVAGIKNNATPNETPNSKVNTPTLDNKTKTSVLSENNKSNNKNNNNNNSNTANLKNITNESNTMQTAKEEAGVYEVVSENYLLLLGITSAIIIMIIIYFFSSSYRVSRAVGKMLVYQGFQQLTSIDISKLGETRIGDYYIASAYNAAHCGYQMYDYTSEHVVLSALQGGARYLEFNIFNSEFGPNAYPVVSMGYKTGEWKMMVNDTPLETIFEIIANNAFKISDGVNGVPNNLDPIFIGLNLNTNSNLSCLNLIAFLITKYFGEQLLDNSYSYQQKDNIADMKMSKAQGKVFIFSSDGFQGSGLEEIVNYSWDNIDNNPKHSMQRLLYSDILLPGYDTNKLIDFNRTGITIVVPHEEGDFFNTNYNTTKLFECGCQFIAMEYQYIDSNMDYYISEFKNFSFVMKNQDLRKGNTNKNRIGTTNPQTTGSSSNSPQTTGPASNSPQTTRPASNSTQTTGPARSR